MVLSQRPNWFAGWRIGCRDYNVTTLLGEAEALGKDHTLRKPSESGIHSLISEEKSLRRSNFRLRWTPGPEGSRYEVIVTTSQFKEVSRAVGLERAEFLISEEDLEEIPSGALLLWRVEMSGPDGARISSLTFSVRLEEDSR